MLDKTIDCNGVVCGGDVRYWSMVAVVEGKTVRSDETTRKSAPLAVDECRYTGGMTVYLVSRSLGGGSRFNGSSTVPSPLVWTRLLERGID